MTAPPQTNRNKALDLGSDDWAMFFELAFWLSPNNEAPDHTEYVPVAQTTLLSLLDDGLAEIAEVHWKSGRYDVVDAVRARSIVLDPHSWRTAQVLDELDSPVLFAYGATEAGRQSYFGSGGAV